MKEDDLAGHVTHVGGTSESYDLGKRPLRRYRRRW